MDIRRKIELLSQRLVPAARITVLTGAGISPACSHPGERR